MKIGIYRAQPVIWAILSVTQTLNGKLKMKFWTSLQGTIRDNSDIQRIRGFLKRYALYKFTFYLLTYLLTSIWTYPSTIPEVFTFLQFFPFDYGRLSNTLRLFLNRRCPRRGWIQGRIQGRGYTGLKPPPRRLESALFCEGALFILEIKCPFPWLNA